MGANNGGRVRGTYRAREGKTVVGSDVAEDGREKRRKKFARSIFLSQLRCVEGFPYNPVDKVHNSGF